MTVRGFTVQIASPATCVAARNVPVGVYNWELFGVLRLETQS
jgi:hypothetical protein